MRRKGTKFDLFGIIFMIIAIVLGNMMGGVVGGIIGFGGGIIGALIVGFIIYVIYTLITGGRIELLSGVIFAFCVWLANLVTGMFGGLLGIGGGIFGLILSAVFLSIIWGFLGAKRKGQSKAPIQL